MTTYNPANELVYRQSLNVTWKRWNVPKKLEISYETSSPGGKVIRKEVWRSIKNIDDLITKKDGIQFAIWRLQRSMDKLRNAHNQLVWETSMSKKQRFTIQGKVYSVWTLKCKLRKYDISGVM
jgi:hypothetical protein